MMIFFVLLGIVGVSLLVAKNDKTRLLGFMIAFVSSVAWVVYGFLYSDYNIILQFACYTIINLFGIKNNWHTSYEISGKYHDEEQNP